MKVRGTREITEGDKASQGEEEGREVEREESSTGGQCSLIVLDNS